jgi:hypothetical protein
VRQGSRYLIWALALLVAGLLVGCGGDDSGDSSSAEAGTDEAAIEETLKGWLTEGGCDRMTDGFLEDQTFSSDPEQACETFEASFTAPAFGPDDIVVSEIQVDGTKASAVVGDEVSNVTSLYELVSEDGQWKIDSVDIQ